MVEHISLAEIIWLSTKVKSNSTREINTIQYALNMSFCWLVGGDGYMKTGPLSLSGPDLSSHEFLQGFHRIPSRDNVDGSQYPAIQHLLGHVDDSTL